MVKLLPLILIITLATICCETYKVEPEIEPDEIQEGIYKGIFIREIMWHRPDTSNVIISFSSDTWFGQSDSLNFPVLGQGTYIYEDDFIVFTNQTNVDEEVDTLLILSGYFQYNINIKDIEIYRGYLNVYWDGFDIDRYVLTKID